MFVGGLRALLLQSLHPLAMAGVAEHSDYRGDPWGRLQRTSTFLAVTTFGTAADAQRAVDKVRGIHRRVHGIAPDGRPYRADDPHLLEWVHIAEVDSFLLAHRLYGASRSTRPAGTVTWPIPRGSPLRSACWTRRAPKRNWPSASRTSVPNCAAQARPRRGPLPADHSPDAAAGAVALRRRGRDSGVDAARVGKASAAAALPAAGGDHRDPVRGACAGRRDPLGDVVYQPKRLPSNRFRTKPKRRRADPG